MRPTRSLEAELHAALTPAELATLGDVFHLPSPEFAANAPFLDLPYSEVDPTWVHRVFSFARIDASNGPIGLPGSFTPIKRGTDLLVFGLRDYLDHLASEFQTEVEALESRGEPQYFLSPGAAYDTAEVFLLAAAFACASFAESNYHALEIGW